jgi:hypothetical protein
MARFPTFRLRKHPFGGVSVSVVQAKTLWIGGLIVNERSKCLFGASAAMALGLGAMVLPAASSMAKSVAINDLALVEEHASAPVAVANDTSTDRYYYGGYRGYPYYGGYYRGYPYYGGYYRGYPYYGGYRGYPYYGGYYGGYRGYPYYGGYYGGHHGRYGHVSDANRMSPSVMPSPQVSLGS